MWFSPGILVAALLITFLVSAGVRASTWWVWMVAILVAVVVDLLLGIRSHNVPKVKTKREYYKED